MDLVVSKLLEVEESPEDLHVLLLVDTLKDMVKQRLYLLKGVDTSKVLGMTCEMNYYVYIYIYIHIHNI